MTTLLNVFYSLKMFRTVVAKYGSILKMKKIKFRKKALKKTKKLNKIFSGF